MADLPIRVQRSRQKGAKLPPNTVCVDRTTALGNPFIVGKDGNQADCVLLFWRLMDGMYLASGRMGIAELKAAHARIAKAVPDLRAKNIACWCAPGRPCHGDVLLLLANRTP